MIHVVVGILANQKNEILVTQRPLHKPYSGYWEFPGGKKENGETSFETLVRELKEELNITVLKADPWKELEYTYPEKTVCLDLWFVSEFTGEMRGLEEQDFQWVELGQLDTIHFLPANKLVLDEIREKFK